MSTVSQTHECETEHEILTYIRVGKSIHKPYGNLMDMKRKTPLTKALDSMSCVAFVLIPVHLHKDVALTVCNVDAGSLYKPKVDVILEKSTESSFGRGSETVLDPSYRRGREIPAADIGINDDIQNMLLFDMKTLMFPGREVNMKLYKLAVYETGGHFDWHMDSTHSDKHQATLLLALNTSWEGGNLVLRRNGVETPVDLRPQKHDPETELQAVAFFTDTEHRAETVKSGVRIVLQYDIEVSEKQGDNDKTMEEGNEKAEGADEEPEERDEENEEGDEEEEEQEEEDEYEREPWMDIVQQHYSERMEVQGIARATVATADEAALKRVLSVIKKMLRKGAEEVAFALQHLYRSASISAEYLKGSDATLYNSLLASGDFDVSLHPVILCEGSGWDGEGSLEERFVYRYDSDTIQKVVDDSDSESPPPRKRQKLQGHNSNEFHIPELSGIVEISRQDFIEYTGNEAMPAQYRYFGGGMFVRPKAE